MKKRNVESISPKRKKTALIGSLILAGFILIFAVCVRCSSYYDSSESHTIENIQRLVGGRAVTSMDDVENLQRRQEMLLTTSEEYPEMIAWLTIPGTMIDYPVMQTDNDSYYASHSYDGETDVYGSLFLASDHASDFSDAVSIVYGRDMANGTMFGALNAFLTEETFDTVSEGVLVLDDCMYRLSILACTIQSGDISDAKLAAADYSGIEMLLAGAAWYQRRDSVGSGEGHYLVLSNGIGAQSGKNCVLIAEMTLMEL